MSQRSIRGGGETGAISAHEAAGSPHPTYATDSDLTTHAALPPTNAKVVYGAVGDGSTDDTTAIQNAINGANHVYLPPGTYIVKNLYLRSNVRVEGAGVGASILKLAGTAADTDYVLRASQAPGTAATGWKLEDLTIDGNKATFGDADTKTLYGLYVGGDADVITDVQITRVEAKNCKTYAFDTVRALRVTYTDCIARDNGFATGTNNNCSGFETLATDVEMKGCRSYANAQYGLAFGQSATVYRRLKVIGGSYSGNGVGGVLIRNLAEHAKVIGADIFGNTGYGVQLNTAKYAKVIGCDIEGNTTYGVRLDGAEGCTVTGNTIKGNNTGGSGGTAEVDFQFGASIGNVISGNRIFPSASGNRANYAIQEGTSGTDSGNRILGNIVSAGSSGTIAIAGTGTLAQEAGGELLQAHGAAGSTETVDLTSGTVHSLTLDANCTLTFAGMVPGAACSFTLVLTQDDTGSRTVTWPASVDWASAVAPTLSTGANKVDVLTFLTLDGGTTWLGFTSGLDLR